MDTTYTFKFIAFKLDADGVEVESQNSEVQTIQLGKSGSKYGFIGRGYDAINGEIFCTHGDGLKDQILLFSEDFTVKNETKNTSDTTYYAGKTFNSYRKNFAESLGISGGYAGFSASFDTTVGFSSSYSEETSFATATSVNVKTKEYLETSQKDLAVLKQHLTPEFETAINNASFKPADLFKQYGTHVMLETDIGGRFVVNYTYTNIQGEEASNFSLSVQANYEGLFSAGASSNTQFDQNSSMSQSNTSISGYTRGGSGAAFSNMENAITSMQAWTDSLADEKVWSLIDAPSTIVNENVCTGIWLFADDAQRQKEIHDAYTELLSKNADSIAAVQTSKWIKDVYLYDSDVLGKKSYKEMKEILAGELPNKTVMFAGENSVEFKELSKQYTGTTLEEKQDEYIKQFDLMRGAGHNKELIKTSAAEMTSRWKLSSEGDGIDIGSGTGGDYIYFRIYYDEDDCK